MSNKKILYIVVGIGLFLGILSYFYSGSETARHNWQHTLEKEGKEPYDLSVLSRTLEGTWGNYFHNIAENSSLVNVFTQMKPEEHENYVYIGKRFYLSAAELDDLEIFIVQGGTAFISSSEMPDLLFRRFEKLSKYEIRSVEEDTVQIKFTNHKMEKSQFSFIHYVKNQPSIGKWNYFNAETLDNSQINLDSGTYEHLATVTTVDMQHPDFICLYHGLGKLYLHSNPQLFSNYYLKSDNGRHYTKQVMEHLNSEDLWYDLSGGFLKTETQTGNSRKNIYDFIGSDAGLKYAWWILVFGVFAFLLIGGKRLQRPIPLIKKPENNTLAFIDSMGHFYFAEKNNIYVFHREWEQFLAFVRYNLHININLPDAEMAAKLSVKCGVQIETVLQVFEMYNKYKDTPKLNNLQLIESNKTLSQFYTEYNNKYGK